MDSEKKAYFATGDFPVRNTSTGLALSLQIWCPILLLKHVLWLDGGH